MKLIGKGIGEIAGPVFDLLTMAKVLQEKETPFAIINPISFMLDEKLNEIDKIIFEKVLEGGHSEVKNFMSSSPKMFEGMDLIYVSKSELEKIISGEINNFTQLGDQYRDESLGYSVLVKQEKGWDFSFQAGFNINN